MYKILYFDGSYPYQSWVKSWGIYPKEDVNSKIYEYWTEGMELEEGEIFNYAPKMTEVQFNQCDEDGVYLLKDEDNEGICILVIPYGRFIQ